MNTDKTTTTVFFYGGPWDGDEAEFADPPFFIRVEGEKICYYPFNAGPGTKDYRWGHQLEPTPAETAAEKWNTLSPPAPPPQQKKRGFWSGFWRVIGIICLVKLSLFVVIFFSTVMWMLLPRKGPQPVLAPPVASSPVSIPTPIPELEVADPNVKGARELLDSYNDFRRRGGKDSDLRREDLEAVHSVAKGYAVPTPAPTPGHRQPDPVPTSEEMRERWMAEQQKRLDAIRESAPAPEVRKALPVTGTVQMPYGGYVSIRVLGTLPNQEALPRLENDIGDAYQIGKDLFVWVAPNGGPAQWIDPVTP